MSEEEKIEEMPQEEEPEAKKPCCCAGLLNIDKNLAFILLLVGLLTIVFSRGCDGIANRSIDKAKAASSLAKSDFETKWDKKEFAIDAEYAIDTTVTVKADSPEAKANQAKRENKAKALTEMQKAMSKERKELRDDWYDVGVAAATASEKSKTGFYWRAWLFLIGALILILGLVSLAFKGDKTEKLFSWIIIAITSYAFFIGKLPFL